MCSGALIWLFCPAWDAVKLTLKVGFICPFVVDDPTDLAIFKLAPTQKTCLFSDGNKANVSVCLGILDSLAPRAPPSLEALGASRLRGSGASETRPACWPTPGLPRHHRPVRPQAQRSRCSPTLPASRRHRASESGLTLLHREELTR